MTSLSDDERLLLDLVPEGQSKGNQALISALSWDEDKYWSVRNSLLAKSRRSCFASINPPIVEVTGMQDSRNG